MARCSGNSTPRPPVSAGFSLLKFEKSGKTMNVGFSCAMTRGGSFSTLLSCWILKIWSGSQFVVLVVLSRWSNQQFRGPWSWNGRWEPPNEADRSWTWSSSQKRVGEWKLVTTKRKKWASGTVSTGGKSSSASSDTSVDKSAIKTHRTFLEVVLGDSQRKILSLSDRN